MNPVVTARELSVRKGGKAICHVSELQIAAGERVGIVGANGSGKSTFLRVLAAIEKEYRGDCRVSVASSDRVYVHQLPYLFRGTVLFNASYGLAARKIPRPERIAIANEWLGKLGVGHLAGRRCSNLSGGERRRVSLARAFALQPKLLLLDEPFADLDAEGVDAVCSAINALPNSTIVIAAPTMLPNALAGLAREFRLAFPAERDQQEAAAE